MNDKRITYTFLSLLILLQAISVSSCVKEEVAVQEIDGGDSDILFHLSMPEVVTRSYDNIEAGDLFGGFTVAAMCPEREGDGNLGLFFEKVLVERTEGMGSAFRGDGCKWPDNTGAKEGRLRFFAFYPSLEVMREKSGVFEEGAADIVPGKEYFLLHDNPASNKKGNTIQYNYRLGNFKVNRDISRHMDLVAASVEGTKNDNLYSGVTLEFEHKLSRVNLKAWNNSPSHAIEIAGVRIGCAIVSSTYNLAGGWLYGSATEVNDVEYIYRSGDTVLMLDGTESNSQATAASVMGKGGWAMVIPKSTNTGSGHSKWWYTAWNPKTDAQNKNAGLFFSVLMRVIDKTDDQYLVLFPYKDGAEITFSSMNGTTVVPGIKADNKNLVYLVVETETGNVLKRIYRNMTTGQYCSDKALNVPYSLEGDEDIRTAAEIRHYGWAAIPYKTDWAAGREYTYIFDYTNGVGLGDPADVNCGRPIITDLSVGVSEDAGVWKMVKDYENVEFVEGEDFTYSQE